MLGVAVGEEGEEGGDAGAIFGVLLGGDDDVGEVEGGVEGGEGVDCGAGRGTGGGDGGGGGGGRRQEPAVVSYWDPGRIRLHVFITHNGRASPDTCRRLEAAMMPGVIPIVCPNRSLFTSIKGDAAVSTEKPPGESSLIMSKKEPCKTTVEEPARGFEPPALNANKLPCTAMFRPSALNVTPLMRPFVVFANCTQEEASRGQL